MAKITKLIIFTASLSRLPILIRVLKKLAYNVEGLAMGWTLKMSSPGTAAQ
jgi:hypothetical protein